METSAAEMRLLSERFYGNKVFFAIHFATLKEAGAGDETRAKQVTQEIYAKYIDYLANIGKDGTRLSDKMLICARSSTNTWPTKWHSPSNPVSASRRPLVS
jgi:hypothetical protein